ncbi:MAG: M48 family metallopeptidase [Candidatus Aminicenantes bacterium]|nr:M48 family metallopeptidase [Candidatus Aminicenantes bacterium]
MYIQRLRKYVCLLILPSFLICFSCAGGKPYTKPYEEAEVGGGFNLFSMEEEIKLGEGFSEEVEKDNPILKDQLITRYVDEMGQNIARHSKQPDIPYHFKVVDTKAVNAFALPGGYIYINRGLLELVDDDSELAGVMAHEIGHVAARHGTKQLSKQLVLAGILIGASEAIGRKSEKWGAITQVAGSLGFFLGMMKYSRDDEREADWLAINEIYLAEYNPEGMVTLFDKFKKLHKQTPSRFEQFFLSHPNADERIKNMSRELNKLDYKGRDYPGSPQFNDMKKKLSKLPPPPDAKKS